jgi:hypothetical protein
MSNGFIYVVDAHVIDKIEKKKKILDPNACDLIVKTIQKYFAVFGWRLS